MKKFIILTCLIFVSYSMFSQSVGDDTYAGIFTFDNENESKKINIGEGKYYWLYIAIIDNTTVFIFKDFIGFDKNGTLIIGSDSFFGVPGNTGNFLFIASESISNEMLSKLSLTSIGAIKFINMEYDKNLKMYLGIATILVMEESQKKPFADYIRSLNFKQH